MYYRMISRLVWIGRLVAGVFFGYISFVNYTPRVSSEAAFFYALTIGVLMLESSILSLLGMLSEVILFGFV